MKSKSLLRAAKLLAGLCALPLIGLAAPAVRAHVGSADVFYDGYAGPYHLYVTVRVPQAIPGVAEIQVRSEPGDIESVQVLALRLSGAGSQFSPAPDVARRSSDDPQFFTGSLWLMESGALQVRVIAEGRKGRGELSVPVASFAQRTLPMSPALRWLLVALMVLLAIGIVSIAGAGVREAKLDPGVQPAAANVRRGRIVMAVAALAVLAMLYFGRAWWRFEDRHYVRKQSFFKPPLAQTSLVNGPDGTRLIIRAKGQTPHWSDDVDMEKLLPDHGHLMHLFLIRTPGLDAMWHLHPQRTAGGAFAEDLPAMPTGRYEVFADIVDESGYPWTLVGAIDLSQINGKSLSGDDSSWSGAPLNEASGDTSVAKVADGGRIVWERPAGALKPEEAMNFDFSVQDGNGKPVSDLEPYMGMAGHAEFVRSDLSVFAHVHPAGSVSMAALELAQAGLPSADGMAMATSSSATLPAEVSFPYGFPRAGEYRIFLQVKRGGRIETAAFDAKVE